MVAVHENYFVEHSPTTLCDWVRNFRVKRVQMKRKLRGDLRVAAMLTTALVNAEAELRRKQQDRFERWLKFQAKLDTGYSSRKCVTPSLLSTAEEEQQRETIEDLWRSELSDLDKFMRAMSSTTRSNCTTSSNSNNNSGSSDNRTCAKEASVAAAAKIRTDIDLNSELSENSGISALPLQRSISVAS